MSGSFCVLSNGFKPFVKPIAEIHTKAQRFAEGRRASLAFAILRVPQTSTMPAGEMITVFFNWLSWQKFIAVAQVVLAELCGRIALRFENLGERRVRFLDPADRSRNSNGGMPVRTGNCPMMNAARTAVQLG